MGNIPNQPNESHFPPIREVQVTPTCTPGGAPRSTSDPVTAVAVKLLERELQQQVDQLLLDNAVLTSRLSARESLISRLQGEIRQLNGEVEDLKNEIKHQEESRYLEDSDGGH